MNRNSRKQNNLSSPRRSASIANEATAAGAAGMSDDHGPAPAGDRAAGFLGCRIRAFRPGEGANRQCKNGRTNPPDFEEEPVSAKRLEPISHSSGPRDRTQIEVDSRPRHRSQTVTGRNARPARRERLTSGGETADLTIGPPADRLSLPRRKGCCADELRGSSPDRLSFPDLPGRRPLTDSGARPWFRLNGNDSCKAAPGSTSGERGRMNR